MIVTFSDPYIKVRVICDGKTVGKNKTSIREKTLCPVYNESYTFTIPQGKVRQTLVELVVMDYDRLSKNDEMGVVKIGEKINEKTKRHWKEMMANSGKPVSYWHQLIDPEEQNN